MDAESVSIIRGLHNDITAFLKIFSSFDRIQYASFVEHWNRLDFSLLTVVNPVDSILQILLQTGLFVPTRPFRDHQLLVFFLFNLFKAAKQPLKLSADRIQVLVGVGMRAKVLGEAETLEALEVLFKREAFVILAEDQWSYVNSSIANNPSATNNVSVEQLLDRVRRIESFLQSRPLFDQRLSKNSLSNLKTLFERYHESKLANDFISSQEHNDQFGATMAGVMKIVEGYEKLAHRSVGSIPIRSSKSRSVRSRLTQSSLTPIIPASASSENQLASDFFASNSMTRPQSVPMSKMGRRPSALRENALDEYIETSTATTNMPNINFY